MLTIKKYPRRITTVILYMVPALAAVGIAAFADKNKPVTEIRYSGLEITSPYVIDSKLKNSTGEPFSENSWLDEKNGLMDLDIFADINLEKHETAEGLVLEYKFVELPYLAFYPAMKRTDQDGLLVGPGITFMNLFGAGVHQELISRFTVAPELLRAKEFLSYTRIPDVFGLNMEAMMTLTYFKSYNVLKLYEENSVYSKLDMVFRLPWNCSTIVSLSSLYVKHDLSVSSATYDGVEMDMFSGAGDWDFLPGAGAGLIMDTRNRKMNPHSGFYSEFKYMLYGEKLGGDSDYSEITGDFRGYFPAAENHIIHLSMLARFRPGTIPAYELYHAGGVNSVRTYDPDPDLCGQHEFLATIEYRYEVFTGKQISFMDINAWYGLQLVAGTDQAIEWLPGELPLHGNYLNSVYMGVHLLVPVLERVRLEFGFNRLNPAEKTITFGINLGWNEKSQAQRRRAR